MKTIILLSIIYANLLLFSCVSTKYMISKTYFSRPSETQDNLLIFLPGRGSDVNDFENQGLLAIFRDSGIPADCVSVNATLHFYMDMSFLKRLETDVFAKPDLTNYKNYWFIGNSMGSLGAMLYVINYPGKIKGIILLGPYLGEGIVPFEIDQSGGLLKWESKIPPKGIDYIRDIWVYLKKCIQDTSGKYPKIIFLSGKDDRYHREQVLVAQALPPDQVFWSPGGHDWDAWKAGLSVFVKSDLAKKLFLPKKH